MDLQELKTKLQDTQRTLAQKEGELVSARRELDVANQALKDQGVENVEDAEAMMEQLSADAAAAEAEAQKLLQQADDILSGHTATKEDDL